MGFGVTGQRRTNASRPSPAGACGRHGPSVGATVVALLALLAPAAALAHDVENTHVLVVFEADDTYRVDVLNDADWLWLQVHPAATADDLPPSRCGTGNWRSARRRSRPA